MTGSNEQLASSVPTPSARVGRDTFALMGIAALLIANSHLEPLYPSAWLAADGLIGNLMFFAISGYGIIKSQTSRQSKLTTFVPKRILRIYPALWFVTLISLITRFQPTPHSAGEGVRTLIWPTDYGFIANIMIFYVIGWWAARLSRSNRNRLHASLTLIWLMATAGLSTFSHFAARTPFGSLPGLWWSLLFLIGFMGGGALSDGDRDGQAQSLSAQNRSIAVIATTAVIYVALKFSYYRFSIGLPTPIVAAGLQGLGVAIAWGLLRQRMAINQLLERLRIYKPLSWIGKSSLEIYLSHIWFIEMLRTYQVNWGVKVILFYISTIVTAFAIRRVIEAVTGRITRLVSERG
jgi:peptidoglycan/LPS O-acetylase OafA/YrhL